MANYDEDDKPHTLVIENEYDEVLGRKPDWSIIHLDDCPVEVFSDGSFDEKHEPLEYHNCRVQAVIDGNGIDDIEDWWRLPPGEYKIVSYYEYYPGDYGGSLGAEHEIDIFMITDENGLPITGDDS